MSRSCNFVRRRNPEDQAAVLDHSEKLRSHTRCNVNLLRVNVIELCTVLYCVVLLQVSEPALPAAVQVFCSLALETYLQRVVP